MTNLTTNMFRTSAHINSRYITDSPQIQVLRHVTSCQQTNLPTFRRMAVPSSSRSSTPVFLNYWTLKALTSFETSITFSTRHTVTSQNTRRFGNTAVRTTTPTKSLHICPSYVISGFRRGVNRALCSSVILTQRGFVVTNFSALYSREDCLTL
jgi:hypothetical protein